MTNYNEILETIENLNRQISEINSIIREYEIKRHRLKLILNEKIREKNVIETNELSFIEKLITCIEMVGDDVNTWTRSRRFDHLSGIVKKLHSNNYQIKNFEDLRELVAQHVDDKNHLSDAWQTMLHELELRFNDYYNK